MVGHSRRNKKVVEQPKKEEPKKVTKKKSVANKVIAKIKKSFKP